MEHELKTWPAFFEEIASGRKTFEVRQDDRGFSVGDILVLREWEPTGEQYTGREVRKVVTYILRAGGPIHALRPTWCVMALGVAHDA